MNAAIERILAGYGIVCNGVTEENGSYVVSVQVVMFNGIADYKIKNGFVHELEAETGAIISVGDEEYSANANGEPDPDYYDTFTVKPC